jgi:putative FmdB family regulatory protein
MSRYEYRCPQCGAFEASYPIGTAPASAICPRCTSASPRKFSPPLLGSTPRPLGRLRDLEDKSAEAPDVVTSIPPRRPAGSRPPANPLQAKLPRS